MTPDRLRGWLKHRPAGSKRLHLAHEGSGSYTILADWERESIDKGEIVLDDLVEQILATAQEYTDAEEEPCKFLIRWTGTQDRIIKVTSHRVRPTPSEADGEEERQVQAADMLPTMREMMRELHRANLEMTKQVGALLSSIQEAYGGTITAQAEHNASLHKVIAELTSSNLQQQPAELTSEQREESLQRARALEALTGKLPDVIDMAILAAAKGLKVAGGDGGASSDGTH